MGRILRAAQIAAVMRAFSITYPRPGVGPSQLFNLGSVKHARAVEWLTPLMWPVPYLVR